MIIRNDNDDCACCGMKFLDEILTGLEASRLVSLLVTMCFCSAKIANFITFCGWKQKALRKSHRTLRQR